LEECVFGVAFEADYVKEAVMGIGFDTLIVCGFAFDPHVSEETKRYGKLTVLPAHMNPDLAMGDELLKKTGAGNLFMVFGEPDLEIRECYPQMTQITQMTQREEKKEKDAKSVERKLVVEIKELDVYDPTTGEVRSNSTDDIACWFIDTDYNEEIFIVRQAYFTGADQPYEKLQRALRAEIVEAA
jgi:adenine-specific DNA-methyltransferase